jgi:hypothetical protein
MMTDFDIASHVVFAQGLSSDEDLRAWAQSALPGMPEGLSNAPLAFTKRLPMMKARRMSPGARLACEAALALEGAGEAKAWIFSSRHGETVRGVKILDAISAGEPPSPTDFMMSVHNAAAGMFSIEGRVHAPASSVAAGAESFHMALVEAAGMLADGMDCVAVVDFDDRQPEALLDAFESRPCDALYATAWLLKKGAGVTMTPRSLKQAEPVLPASLQLAAGLASERSAFVTSGAAVRDGGHRDAGKGRTHRRQARLRVAPSQDGALLGDLRTRGPGPLDDVLSLSEAHGRRSRGAPPQGPRDDREELRLLCADDGSPWCHDD